MTAVGCDTGESGNVCSWLIIRVGVVLRRTVVGCDTGESRFVNG